MVDLRDIQRSTFEPLLGETFALQTADGKRADVHLIKVTPLKGARVQREPFSLTFRGPAEVLFPQQLFTLFHAGTGAVTLFMVPVGREGDAPSGPVHYEAIFA